MDDKSIQGLTRKEVAKRFGVSVGTVRAWQRNFASWLEVEKQQYGGGRRQATRYSDSDLKVFVIVDRLTDEGLNYDDIREVMDEELESQAYEVPEAPPEEEVKDKEPGVSLAKYSAVVASLQRAEGTLEARTEERDFLRERLTVLEESQAKERERLQDRIDTLEEKLDEERQKSWFQKLRGR